MWNRYLNYRAQWPGVFADHAPSGLRTDPDAPAKAHATLGVVEEHPDWLWVREWDGVTVTERPIYLDAALRRQIEGYFALAARRPDLFVQSPYVPLCMDRYAMLTFHTQTGKPVGLVFDNGRFYQVVADLIDTPERFAYARMVYPDRKGNGTVMIPCWQGEGKTLFGILHIYRHALRARSGGEFPRGFLEPGLSPEENCAKELREELAVRPELLDRLVPLGGTRADTGLSGGEALVYLAQISGPQPQGNAGHEGILSSEWLTLDELLRRIRCGEIKDGFTQNATLLYLLQRPI